MPEAHLDTGERNRSGGCLLSPGQWSPERSFQQLVARSMRTIRYGWNRKLEAVQILDGFLKCLQSYRRLLGTSRQRPAQKLFSATKDASRLLPAEEHTSPWPTAYWTQENDKTSSVQGP